MKRMGYDKGMISRRDTLALSKQIQGIHILLRRWLRVLLSNRHDLFADVTLLG